MARDYEVREEYKSYGLSQLMDAPVLCFQGVGDIQAELLKQYFGISTVRELANWPQFMWSLEIQELALNGGDLAHTSIEQIAQTSPPKFQVRGSALVLTPEQLMHAGVQELEGLTPAQDLGLYDIFRITNVAQLAHNRIMLEARVIQYLEGQGGASASTSEAAAEGVDQVLGRQSGAAAQRIMEGRKAGRDERLHSMASDTRAHVRERIAAVRERARGRAGSAAAAGGGQASRSDVMAGVQRGVSSDRLASIATRRTTVAGGVSRDRGTSIDQGRNLRRASGDGSAVAGRELATRNIAGRMSNVRSGTGGSRTDAVLAARGGGGGATRSFGRPGGGGGGGGVVEVHRQGAQEAAEVPLPRAPMPPQQQLRQRRRQHKRRPRAPCRARLGVFRRFYWSPPSY